MYSAARIAKQRKTTHPTTTHPLLGQEEGQEETWTRKRMTRKRRKRRRENQDKEHQDKEKREKQNGKDDSSGGSPLMNQGSDKEAKLDKAKGKMEEDKAKGKMEEDKGKEGEVELESSHLSIHSTWKAWLHRGSNLRLSCSENSQRQTAQPNSSFKPKISLYWKTG